MQVRDDESPGVSLLGSHPGKLLSSPRLPKPAFGNLSPFLDPLGKAHTACGSLPKTRHNTLTWWTHPQPSPGARLCAHTLPSTHTQTQAQAHWGAHTHSLLPPWRAAHTALQVHSHKSPQDGHSATSGQEAQPAGSRTRVPEFPPGEPRCCSTQGPMLTRYTSTLKDSLQPAQHFRASDR